MDTAKPAADAAPVPTAADPRVALAAEIRQQAAAIETDDPEFVGRLVDRVAATVTALPADAVDGDGIRVEDAVSVVASAFEEALTAPEPDVERRRRAAIGVAEEANELRRSRRARGPELASLSGRELARLLIRRARPGSRHDG